MAKIQSVRKSSRKVGSNKWFCVQDAEKAATIDVQQEPSTPPIAGKEQKEGVVYAELDLQATTQHSRPTVVVRPDDDKTEYAEIIHTKNKDPPAGKWTAF